MAAIDAPAVEEVDWLALVERMLSLGICLYCVWIMFPGVQIATKAALYRLTADYRARKRRERDINRMAWETYLIAQEMEKGGGDDLERRLNIA